MLTYNIMGSGDDQRITGVVDNKVFNVIFNNELLTSLKTFQQELENIDEVSAYEAWVDRVVNTIDEANTVDLVTQVCDDLILDKKTGNYYVKVGDVVSKHAVPQPLVTVILESAEKQIDPTPIVKAWIRFLRNPNFTTTKAELFAKYITTVILDTEEIDMLMQEEGYTYEKAAIKSQYRDVTITNEGLLVTKKYSRLLTKGWVIDPDTNEAVLEDLYKTNKTVDKFSGEVTEEVSYPEFTEELTFEPPVYGRGGDAFFCGDVEDHVMRVGNIIKLRDWSMVNTDDTQNYVKGLHVGRICRLAV